MIKVSGLVQYALNAVGKGYCWGADGQTCSPEFRQELARRAPDQAANLLNVCAKWDGMPVWDCSGLFRGAWRKLAAYKSGGATTIYDTWCVEKGPIDTMPDEPGIAVFRWDGKKMKHTGLYTGNGLAIEARGSAQGVIRCPLSSYPWTHWGRLMDVEYAGVAAKPINYPYRAEVINVKTGLNLCTSPKNSSNTIQLLPLGTVVEVLEDNCGDGFSKVRYGDIVGYCTRSYLYQLASETSEEPGRIPAAVTYGSIAALVALVVALWPKIRGVWPKLKAMWARIWNRKKAD